MIWISVMVFGYYTLGGRFLVCSILEITERYIWLVCLMFLILGVLSLRDGLFFFRLAAFTVTFVARLSLLYSPLAATCGLFCCLLSPLHFFL